MASLLPKINNNIRSYNNQCIYTLTVTYNDKQMSVSYPLTCEFSITRAPFTSYPEATFNIYNLSPEKRQSEFFYQNDVLDNDKFKYIEFSAGYANSGQLTTCFKGRIMEAYSTRRGTDVVTTIQATDVNEGLKTISRTFKKGTTFLEAYNNIASEIGLKTTAIGSLEGTFKTDKTFNGTLLDILNQITNNNVFIDNSELKVLNDNESLAIPPIELDSSKGIIGTPDIKGNMISIKTLFNPNVLVYQRVNLNSKFLNNFNGMYKVFGIVHTGVFSGAIAGDRITTLEMQIRDTLANSCNITTGNTEYEGQMLVDGNTRYSDSDIQQAENVYRYIRQHNGAIPNWKINPMINWNDMLGHSNSPSERYNELTKPFIANCEIIANMLYKFINTSTLKGQRITVTSGWRSQRVNKVFGGKPNSVHLKGGAIDFRFTSINTRNAYNNVFAPVTGWQNYTYLSNTKNFIHVQFSKGQGGALRNRGE